MVISIENQTDLILNDQAMTFAATEYNNAINNNIYTTASSYPNYLDLNQKTWTSALLGSDDWIQTYYKEMNNLPNYNQYPVSIQQNVPQMQPPCVYQSAIPYNNGYNFPSNDAFVNNDINKLQYGNIGAGFDLNNAAGK